MVIVALGLLAAPTGVAAKKELRKTLDFAAKMAESGNWREAQFRWNKADRLDSDNYRIVNNLAVAAEVLGDNDEARRLYDAARGLSPDDRWIQENVFRFERFERLRREAEDDPAGDAEDDDAASDTATGDGGSPAPRRDNDDRRDGRDAKRVLARFQLPPRLDVDPYKSILVASFRTEDGDLLDSNREITRFLRAEFRRRSALDVADVVPAPAIPEQPLEDMILNTAFWRHLGKEYDTDLVVSGLLRYQRRDASGFEDVDVVSPVTGQKVRRTQFVEKEQFQYVMDLLFFDGATGQLVFRDKLRRGVVYQGTANDALTAFHDLVELISREVIAVVSPRVREDTRFVFRD